MRARRKNPDAGRAPTPDAHPDRAVADAVLGAVAGAVGVWAMDQVGWFMLRTESTPALVRDLQARPGKEVIAHDTAEQVRSIRGNPLSGAEAASATTTATQVSGVSAPDRKPGPAATAFHFGLGMLPGAVYAIARRPRPRLRTGYGALYGLGLFTIMDETAAPLTGIASEPSRYPWQAHARGLVAHLVLGITTEILLRATDHIRCTDRR